MYIILNMLYNFILEDRLGPMKETMRARKQKNRDKELMGKEFTNKNIIPGIAPENHGTRSYISPCILPVIYQAWMAK